MSTFLFIISTMLLLLLAYFIFRVIVRRDYQKKKKLGWFATSCEFLIFALHANFCYAFLPVNWWEIPDLPENQLHSIIGISLLVIGFILTLLSMGYLGFKKACGQQVDGLRNSGIYGKTRNPQIIFYTILLAGIVVLWFSWYSIIWLLIYLIIAHLMVTTEEEHLRNVYGKSYEEYSSRVPRYF